MVILAVIPQATTEWAVSHWVQSDAPERVNQLMVDFLQPIRGQMPGCIPTRGGQSG